MTNHREENSTTTQSPSSPAQGADQRQNQPQESSKSFVGIEINRSGSRDPIVETSLSDKSGLFAVRDIRQAFVTKVYAILSIQLIATTILIGVCVLSPTIKQYFKSNPQWRLFGLLIMLIPYFIFICNESARRRTPHNYILLSVLTGGYGFVAAVIACQHNLVTVLSAFLATGVSCLLISLLSKSKLLDITKFGWSLMLLGFGHLLLALILFPVMAMLGAPQLGSYIISVLGAMLVSVYLLYDMQLIIGGHKCELSPEEYIFGAVMLYIDIIQLFLFMLRILSDD